MTRVCWLLVTVLTDWFARMAGWYSYVNQIGARIEKITGPSHKITGPSHKIHCSPPFLSLNMVMSTDSVSSQVAFLVVLGIRLVSIDVVLMCSDWLLQVLGEIGG